MTIKIPPKTMESISVPNEKIGTPGIHTNLLVLPTFKGEKIEESDKRLLLDKSQKGFTITARLSKGNFLENDINFIPDEESGDSLLHFPDTVERMEISVKNNIIIFYPNKNRRLSIIKFECISTNYADALKIFKNLIGPALDHLSYLTNTPLHVAQTTIHNQNYDILSTEIITPYPLVLLNTKGGYVSEALAPVYAMYREAINSFSPFYKFFCYYKILEGLLVKLTGKFHEKAKAKKITLPPLLAKVPTYNDITEDQRIYVGKSITKFFNEFLTIKFRNGIAHFVTDEGSILNVNEMQELERYSNIIQISEMCCREVISHFEKCTEILEQAEAA